MKKTKKLVEAIRILKGKRYADCTEAEFWKACEKHKVKSKQIYEAVEHFGFRWDAKEDEWERQFPRWLEKMMDDLP